MKSGMATETSTPKQLGIIGLGNWGTALANHLAVKGHDVLGWAIEPDIVAGIESARRNPRFLAQVTLSANLHATNDLSAVLARPNIVLALPSSALGDMTPRLLAPPSTLVISAIKGVDEHSLDTPLQHIEKLHPGRYRLVVISGPSFARDVVVQRPCGVVAASRDSASAREVARIFSSDSMRVFTSSDPLGVEIGGITKNVIALAVGISDGLELGDSARAGLITRGLAEMMRLAEAMGAERQTLAGLSGLGDLAMTATCDQSRNRTVGLRLGRGEALDDIIASLGSVAEGVSSTPLVLALAKRHGVEMAITRHVSLLLEGKLTTRELVQSLLALPVRSEFA
jgi:glycerol-3-phosphate dehydrogenase (NAD(P)+)